MLDTDCLVAAAFAERSASRRVLEACLRGEVIALVSPDLQHEYEYILGRAVRERDIRRALQRFLGKAGRVHPSETPREEPLGLVMRYALTGGGDRRTAANQVRQDRRESRCQRAKRSDRKCVGVSDRSKVAPRYWH